MFICLPCLSQVTAREPSDVRSVVDALLAERRAESQAAKCLNCNAMAFVVRRRWPDTAAPPRPGDALADRAGRVVELDARVAPTRVTTQIPDTEPAWTPFGAPPAGVGLRQATEDGQAARPIRRSISFSASSRVQP
jgi:hypothetical protein